MHGFRMSDSYSNKLEPKIEWNKSFNILLLALKFLA